MICALKTKEGNSTFKSLAKKIVIIQVVFAHLNLVSFLCGTLQQLNALTSNGIFLTKPFSYKRTRRSGCIEYFTFGNIS